MEIRIFSIIWVLWFCIKLWIKCGLNWFEVRVSDIRVIEKVILVIVIIVLVMVDSNCWMFFCVIRGISGCKIFGKKVCFIIDK